MPNEIKNLIETYKDTKFTIDIYEKYRFYKKFNEIKKA
jgi:hypothetical protein